MEKRKKENKGRERERGGMRVLERRTKGVSLRRYREQRRKSVTRRMGSEEDGDRMLAVD